MTESNNINYKAYRLKNGRELFYLPKYARFWLDCLPEKIDFCTFDTEISRLRIEISHICNGRCSYCIVFGNNVQKTEIMDIHTVWSWLVLQPYFQQIKEIFIIGGEPFLHFDIIRFILEHFRGKIYISTNATLITQEIAQILSHYDVEVFVSLDGATAKDNENRRFSDGTMMYQQILKGYEYLQQSNIYTGIFMVGTPENAGNILQTMFRLKSRFSPKEIGYSLPHWVHHQPNLLSPIVYRDALLELYHHRKELDIPILQIEWRLKPMKAGKTKLFSCALHTTQKTLLPDGSIVRCSKIDHDPNCAFLDNEYLNTYCPVAIADFDTHSRCFNCIALGSCGGGCCLDAIKRFHEAIDRRECIITPPIIQAAIDEIIAYLNQKNHILPSGAISSELVKSIIEGVYE